MIDESPPPRRGLPPEDESPTPTAPGRRWADAPADLDFFAVPPPAPVLPTGSGPSSPGRRFSADDLPDDWTPPPPRRSAASPSGGGTPASPASPTIPPPPGPAPAHRPAGRPALLGVALTGALALALVGAWFLLGRPGAPAAVSATQPRAALAQPAELAGLRAGTTWTPTDDDAPDETRGLRCISPGNELRPVTPLAGRTLRRTFTSASGEPATVVQQVETYTDAAAATQGYAARLAQLGGCSGSPDLVLNGFTVAGLGEQAGAVRVVEQDAAAAVHHLLVVRAGTSVTIVDAHSGTTPPPLDAVASALQPSVDRLCQGGCPGTPTVSDADQPPAGVPAGFLTSGDLPRVNPGAGVWIGAQLQPMALAGSGCEAVDLTAVPKATAAAQQAFVLKGDPQSSPNFGLDQVLYTFASDADATAFAAGLLNNLRSCTATTPTATVRPLGTLPAPAVGQLFTVDQRTSLDRLARSRVMVGATGVHVVYVAANPTPQFDLSDAAWLDVLQRAVNRAKQLS